MDFHLLGPLEVRDGDRPLRIGEGRQRSVLALLLLHHDEPVAVDRLIDELWGAQPPATAGKVLQNNVAQLRRALGDGQGEMLRTLGRAYVLELDGGRLDVERFEDLAARGSAALENDPERARALLAEALSLWRGPALADFAYEEFAQAQITGLEQRRLAALEDRIDADLALGRHDRLVGELEGLVAEHPARERLRGQLMLALYRAGRQGDALRTYQEGRQALADELGVEPGPRLRAVQAAILRQDPELAPPPTAWASIRRRSRTRAAALVAGGGVLLLVAAIATALLIAGGGENAPARPTGAVGGELVQLDAATGHVRRRIAAGRTPNAVAVSDRSALLVDAESRTLLQVDTRSGKVEAFTTGATPVDVAAGGAGIWVVDALAQPGSPAGTPITSDVTRIDPATARPSATVRLTPGGPVVDRGGTGSVAVTRDAVWVVGPDTSVRRIDPATATVTARSRGLRASSIAAGGAGVWAADEDGSVDRLDERTARPHRVARIPGGLGGIAVGDGAVWGTTSGDGRLWRVRARRHEVPASVAVGSGAAAVVATSRAVWVANPVAGTVTQVDPDSMRVVRRLRLGGLPRSLAADGRSLWVAVTGGGSASSARVAGVTPLPASRCDPPVGGGGRADVLIVSDLPVHGDAGLGATQMAEAIALTLREHGFRAGRFRLAYQSCNDALPGTGFSDQATCVANGRAYGANADVVGVIGTWDSGCAESILPWLNRAVGGPVPMVSPLNSAVDLTRRIQDPALPGLFDAEYSTGVRNFVRVYPADDRQGAALVAFARDRGRHRLFVLDDGLAGYSVLIADAGERAARRLGVDVVGRARWSPTASSYRRLARRIAATGADAVLLGGLLPNHGGRLVKDLHAELGPSVDLLASDGFGTPADLVRAAGRTARHVFLAAPGLPVERVPPVGERFVRRFARTQPGLEVDAASVYAAQAAEVLRQAIARSKGTRASVLDALFATRLHGSLTGDVAFDRRGDRTRNAETIERVVGGIRGGPTVLSARGTKIVRIMQVGP
ncbi:MAG TPA: BTAD domain-containing putative transcriptional regulator [Solirubrobacteraceae bacterium]|nr:BTAD domain-containing putative transcriptional regulator [Solirubrobacteraceae bacterium]